MDLWLKDFDAFCAKTRDMRKVGKNRDVIRKPYIHCWAFNKLNIKNILIHYDLELLKELVQLIDQQIEKICQLCSDVDDPDSLGYFDRGEHVMGLGFVACQTFMSSVCGHLGVSKGNALAMGPSHSSGTTKAQIVNHAANYWKHKNEWNLSKKDIRRDNIEKAFESVGFSVDLDYPLSCVLAEISLPGEARFQSILGALDAWKDELGMM